MALFTGIEMAYQYNTRLTRSMYAHDMKTQLHILAMFNMSIYVQIQ